MVVLFSDEWWRDEEFGLLGATVMMAQVIILQHMRAALEVHHRVDHMHYDTVPVHQVPLLTGQQLL